MKKTICAFLTAIMLLSVIAVPVSARPFNKLLLLGDSITYGYGLEGGRDNCPSYGNLLREHLNIPVSDFRNAAVNGYKSQDLLKLLPSLRKYVKDANLIVITIGGNDLLAVVWAAIDKLFPGGLKDYSQVAEIMNDTEKLKILASELSLQKVSAAVTQYTVNIASVMNFIRSENADAEVIFLAQYNPLHGIEQFKPLASIAGTAIVMLNAAMKTQTKVGKCTYLDTYTPFLEHSAEWTNIVKADIHPNALGHRELYRIVSEYVDSLPDEKTDKPAETTSKPADTTSAPAETTVKPDDTTAKSSGTTAVTEPEPVTTAKEEKEKSGCGSAFSVPLALLPLIGCAFVLKKKKH